MIQLNLDTLKEGLPVISKNIGAYLAEAAAYCLTRNGHQSGVILDVSGAFEEQVKVIWEQKIDEETARAWADGIEATEYGAVALAILLIQAFTTYNTFERSVRGTGFDYWLGMKDYEEEKLPFWQRKARLEVSGIWKENRFNTINTRIELKKKQVLKSDGLNLPVLIVVVEFSTPKSKIHHQ